MFDRMRTLGFLFLSNLTFFAFSKVDLNDICKHGRHIAGHWINGTQNKSFYCCGWDDRHFAANTSVCGTEGYDREKFYKGSIDRMTQIGDFACTCNTGSEKDPLSLSQREMYKWEPTYCDLLPWDALNFCEVLGTRVILLVGDSSMQQCASTLMSMITFGKGKCADQILMARLDYLIFPIKQQTDFMKLYEKYRPDIIIMTTGAHYEDMGDMYTVWDKIPKLLTQIRASNPSISVAWKTQNPGHVNCHDFKTPIDTFPLFPKGQDKYNWAIFPQYDRFNIEQSIANNVKVIDMSPLYLRPDSHTDCLHFCAPGPLDLFSILVYNMLYTKEI